MIYSRFLVRHHWFLLNLVVAITIALTIVGILCTQLPDFSDPRKGWGARGKGTIFSQLMVLRHASEKFRRAYELPLENYELFSALDQFSNVTTDRLDENSYRSEFLAKSDLWRKNDEELHDYQQLDASFYDTDHHADTVPDYDDQSQSGLIYQWHRDRHFDLDNVITKYVDDKMINITVMDFVKSLPEFNRSNVRTARLPFDLFRPYAYLLEEQYRGRAGRDGMIEIYLQRIQPTDDLLSLSHLQSICQWEKKFKDLLHLQQMPSLSLATFVALYASKNDCQLITERDIVNFREILQTCLPYYINGYMDIPISDAFLNRVSVQHLSGEQTYQEQTKAIYTALRHTCFYKNITRLIFDHFLDKNFLHDLQQEKSSAKVSLSMIYISNYQVSLYNRTRDQTMCLRREPYSKKYCRERGCLDDYRNDFLTASCRHLAPPVGSCEDYCQCKYQCQNETEEVVLLTPVLRGDELVQLFDRYFPGGKQLKDYRDGFTKLVALNFANVRERAAMARIYRDIFLVLIATILIILITVLYLRSITIALIIVIAAALTIGVSYFIYRVIYRIPIFPFMNLMSAFILIGIGCDDIFVFFDTWEQEKLRWLRKHYEKLRIDNVTTPLNENASHDSASSNQKIQPKHHKDPSNAFDNPYAECDFDDEASMRKVVTSEEALTEIMSETLKHAGSSMFVTSFTTSAAFFTNMLTNISFVQVFGVFTGTCILLYFFITVTAIAAFAVIYEKHIRTIFSHVVGTSTSPSIKRDTWSRRFRAQLRAICHKIRYEIFCHYMPMMIIKLRYILVLLLFCLGILGLVGVFHYPKLQVPRTQKVLFFLKDNPFEVYEFGMKKEFNGYSKEEKRLFAYPSVSFIFGIQDIDDGYIFDMDDRGHLHLMPVHLERQQTLDFFKEFIRHLGTRKDLFASNYDLEKDFESFYELSSDNILISRLVNEAAKHNVSKTDHLTMIHYLRGSPGNLIDRLVSETVRTVNYSLEQDQSDQEDHIDRNAHTLNRVLYRKCLKQLSDPSQPLIVYSNYRKSFNRTLKKLYQEQIEQNYDLNRIRSMLNGSLRDQLTEDYQRSALKTAMQCLTGAAGENNVPADFCQLQLNKQRSVNWAVLPDKPSVVDGSVRPFAVIITIRGTLNRTDYDSYNRYYSKVKGFFDPYIKAHAPAHLQHAWFSSPGFAFYGVQRELLVGSYSSLIASLAIALCVLFLTSGNFFIAFYALLTITFAIAVGVAIFAALEWELGIVEAIIVIMSVGLSVDFVVHFGVGYIHANIHPSNRETKDQTKPHHCWVFSKEDHGEREARVIESVSRVGSAVFMAAFTTFAAGFSMTLSTLSSFRQMGQFLMTIMLTSWIFATFFFLPLCAILGPVGRCGSIPFHRFAQVLRRSVISCRRELTHE